MYVKIVGFKNFAYLIFFFKCVTVTETLKISSEITIPRVSLIVSDVLYEKQSSSYLDLRKKPCCHGQYLLLIG